MVQSTGQHGRDVDMEYNMVTSILNLTTYRNDGKIKGNSDWKVDAFGMAYISCIATAINLSDRAE